MEAISSSFETNIIEATMLDGYFDSHAGYARGPVRALLEALLFDGVQTYLNHVFSESEASVKKSEEAYRWVHESDESYIFSFNNVCEALGIDSDFLRLGLINAANSQSFEWKRSRRHF